MATMPGEYSMGGTFTLTTTYAASATFSFNGTGVTIFGAKRQNHGFFNITLDGTFISTNNGSSGALDGIWGPLFSSGPLEDGWHTIVVVNSGSGTAQGYFDLDYIGFNTSVTTDTQRVQDTHPSFSYRGSGWSTAVANAAQYNGTNGHMTCDPGDSVTYTFQGDAWCRDSVQVYGALAPAMGSYSVSLDGGESALYDGKQAIFYGNTMLYAASALPSGRHDVTLTNVGDPSNSTCLSIDYAIAGLADLSVSLSTSGSATNGAGATQTSSPSGTAAATSATRTSSAAIAGVCVGAAIFVGLVFAALWFFFFRRRRATRKTAMAADNPPEYSYQHTESSHTSETRQTDLSQYNFVLPNPHYGGSLDANFGLPSPEHLAIPAIQNAGTEEAFSPQTYFSGTENEDYPRNVSSRIEPNRKTQS
ncbi:hypothetical protein GLOTRDRAFT_140897 [Gloeophyllum trabeum ATCC 11539]|uniref:Uncharacterized protein n=1 Tax=Gloeophyllum trabeum (strain ATCC 11539 / FP-39264 / Madison 617) TaxID=670483 RepID=S7RB22_GLOTA|nr:uncharacterized protein GLOTRDRAFT_140897 [Gloeophyllum trabeum ATCC 11539]EPQ51440.1 hypothetical protein GLOTRDRAFT_140897 [Gloeophyllum trabeum ATCC 11539]